MASDPVFNDFYYLRGPAAVDGNPNPVDFGGSDLGPGTGISLLMGENTLGGNSDDNPWVDLNAP